MYTKKGGKISLTTATKNGMILAIFRRFLPLCIVFSPITTATSCQDAEFFPGTYDIPIYTYDIPHLYVTIWSFS